MPIPKIQLDHLNWEEVKDRLAKPGGGLSGGQQLKKDFTMFSTPHSQETEDYISGRFG
ncbi:hypothetical protein CIPA99_01802 [Corynebacterium diphtheriae]|uniref:hypothetical protein n=1 Tax=Corynebacterium diphtheriae TaxID=1717 RepID=UPI00026029FF|nr:hypothetical protein W5M_09137 [Corynebacterium diphtheriae bv. intermedius str. NCTC 5011]CAB0660866.1 hypothetical protein CIPA99_01802 [Corynebacterium diphtheriae]CAB0917325.1 hypothetical protein FRC0420_02056 [Corynebacterium diphtheriae]